MSERMVSTNRKNTFLEMLRDPIWQFVGGVVLGCIAIAISIYSSIAQRDIYALQVVVLANTSLAEAVEVDESIYGQVELLYNDQSIINPTLLQLKLENTGNQAIRKEDYSESIQFVFASEVNIIKALILETSPGNIAIEVEAAQNILTLSPVLLNPDDRIIIRLFLSGITSSDNSAYDFEVNARIAEVQRIPVINAIDQSSRQVLNVRLVISMSFGIGIVVNIIFLCIYGFKYMVSSDDQETEKARNSITTTIIRLVIIVAVYIIIGLAWRMFGLGDLF